MKTKTNGQLWAGKKTKSQPNCRGCEKELPDNQGGRVWCSKPCQLRWRYKNEVEKRQTDPELHRIHLEKQRKYYRLHQKERRATAKRYRENNAEQIKAERLRHYHKVKDTPEHKKSMAKRAKKWSQKNREKIRDNWNLRMKTDVEFALRNKTRTRISNAIRYHVKGLRKSKGTVELLGCSLSFFKKHLEGQFTKDMSWNQFIKGNIHLDHIKSCWSFDLTQVKEQKKCFNYRNVQPLWAYDNLAKNRF
jgi:hypothetical protein